MAVTPGDVYADAALVAGRNVLVPSGGRVAVGVPGSAVNPTSYLDVIDRGATLDQLAQTVALSRAQDVGADGDLLALDVTATSTDAFQFIEASRGLDVEFRVDGDGAVFADGAFVSPAADFAEMLRVASGARSVEPGDVLVIDTSEARSVALSTRAHSTLVAGVCSTRPGFVGSERAWDLPADPASGAAPGGEPLTADRAGMAAQHEEVPVALVGIVPCKVTAANGPIRPGDLLVTSAQPGHAMRTDAPRPGTVLGKALDTLESGTGVIKVLVKLQ